MVQLFETYMDMGGNSYVKTIYGEFLRVVGEDMSKIG